MQAAQTGASARGADDILIDLSGSWDLTSPGHEGSRPIALPGDVHTALLASGEIDDPYYGDNEQKVMWVSRVPWAVERTFTVDEPEGHWTLTLSEVDCIARIIVNGHILARTDNQFIRWDIDVSGRLVAGENAIRIEFDNVRDEARARYEAHPFPIPYHEGNQPHMAHINFVRKTACHGGWDWGICLMPTGVYGTMELRRSEVGRLESVQVFQHNAPDSCELDIRTRVFASADGVVDISHEIDGITVGGPTPVRAGENVLTHRVTIDGPDLWWPAGQGDQPLYTLTTRVGGQSAVRRIGIRRLDWVVEPDAIDHSFKCRINGRDITMMGANWIPADAIPSRITPEAVRDLLESAVAANMNMIRVWGGGQYEPDWFYDLCDELGLLVWQDFMFSCMPYPTNPAFLESVGTEAVQQVRRLQHHASLAIWCGDNEVIGSINWFEETRANRDRFVANYDRLSKVLSDAIAAEDPGRRFWPSSPSLGYLDFSDGWHTDTRGDMHYWDVWHSAKPFEAYRTVNPRFASEFGFQSFTSENIIESFTAPEDRNPSSPVMETHQRNDGGNARILETMCRYFRFPKGFSEMVFLSQVQQGLAIKTAIEYWRSTKPRCMGTLYWQLNDTWPVHSWASLDYGGQWKPLHYMARRFFLPLSVVPVPDPAAGEIVLKGVNDASGTTPVWLEVSAVSMDGVVRALYSGRHDLVPDTAVEIVRVPDIAVGENEFLYVTWAAEDGTPIGATDFFPRPYKHYSLPDAQIAATWSRDGESQVLELETDQPAFFVQAQVNVPGYFSDNAVTLVPGRVARLKFTPRQGADADAEALAASLRIRHLAETY